MKVSSGMMELVIMMALMVSSVPLLCALVITCNGTKMDYLSDKSVMHVSDSVEWVTVKRDGKTYYYPDNLAPIQIDYGGAQAIAIVNDDYCPDDGKIVRFDYTNNSVLKAISSDAATLEIKDGWKSLVNKAWLTQLNKSKNAAYKSSQCYLVWNTKSKQWMITTEFVNIFE
jgi:hypothetical protein